jgi:hypothetical protein
VLRHDTTVSTNHRVGEITISYHTIPDMHTHSPLQPEDEALVLRLRPAPRRLAPLRAHVQLWGCGA